MDRKHQHAHLQWLALGIALLGSVLAGCEGIQSALEPKGPAAAAIAESHWLMVAGGAAVLALVTGLALYAVYRPPGRRARVSSTTLVIAGGVVLPVASLTALLVYGVFLMDRLRGPPSRPEEVLEIRVVARQWWWEVLYPADVPGRYFAVANELRLPAGRPIALLLTSEDVIHSFWIPALAGKMDVIPGHVRRLTLQANAAGRLRGQCAEFCGAQHAHMILSVVVEPAEAFERWLAAASGTASSAAGRSDTSSATGGAGSATRIPVDTAQTQRFSAAARSAGSQPTRPRAEQRQPAAVIRASGGSAGEER